MIKERIKLIRLKELTKGNKDNERLRGNNKNWLLRYTQGWTWTIIERRRIKINNDTAINERWLKIGWKLEL